MNGIVIDKLCPTSHTYAVRIDGKWYQIKHGVDRLEPRLRDGASRGEIIARLKREPWGHLHSFELKPCTPPNQKLPDEVEKFVKYHTETGMTLGFLTVRNKRCKKVPRALKEGWRK